MTQGLKILIAITFISWCIYPIMWVLGSEGLSAVSLDFEVKPPPRIHQSRPLPRCSLIRLGAQQVGLITLADLVSKLAFGFYLMFAVLDTANDDLAESELPFLPNVCRLGTVRAYADPPQPAGIGLV